MWSSALYALYRMKEGWKRKVWLATQRLTVE
jgi:hypothetical protein